MAKGGGIHVGWPVRGRKVPLDSSRGRRRRGWILNRGRGRGRRDNLYQPPVAGLPIHANESEGTLVTEAGNAAVLTLSTTCWK